MSKRDAFYKYLDEHGITLFVHRSAPCGHAQPWSAYLGCTTEALWGWGTTFDEAVESLIRVCIGKPIVKEIQKEATKVSIPAFMAPDVEGPRVCHGS